MRKNLCFITLIAVLLAASFAPALSVQAAPGDLDPGFGGFSTGSKFVANSLLGGSVAIQPDGRIVVAGYNGIRLFVRRYLSNGQPDITFDGDGAAEYVNPQFSIRPTDVAVQPDGKIVVAGYTDTPHQDFMVARLTASGAEDITFGGDGYVTTHFPYGDAQARAVIVQPDGKVVAGGYARIGDDDDFVAVRYTTGGTPDNSFSQDGIATIGFGGDDLAYDMVRLSDGRLVLAGENSELFDVDFALASLNPNGTPDETFDDDGEVTTGFGQVEWAHAVAVYPDDRILAMGNRPIDGLTMLARYWPSGALDGSFGSSGLGKISIPNSDTITDVAVQPDGRILLLGSSGGDFYFRRLTASGADDPTFGDNGRVYVDFGAVDRGTGLALQADGRILGIGGTGPNVFDSAGSPLVRLRPDGTFDVAGQQTYGLAGSPRYVPGSSERAYGLVVDGSGRSIVAGDVMRADNIESDGLITRFLSDGRVDASFGTNGSLDIGWGQYDSLRAVARQPDGNLVVAGYTDPPGDVAANFVVARVLTGVGFAGTLDGEFGFGGMNLVDFEGGGDYGTSVALAPDGRIVMAGSAWNGQRSVIGVARLTSAGWPDNTFGGDGEVMVDFVQLNAANAVAVQPDGKILVAGQVGGDFAVLRLNEDGSTDYTFGPGNQGLIIHDMGGFDEAFALALTPGGWFYTAGYRDKGNGDIDFALAQYTERGVLASCPGFVCQNWDTGTLFLDWGGAEMAFALDWRGDNRLVAAGCADGQFAWAQVRTGRLASPMKQTTDFAGPSACAAGVQFAGADRVMLAGVQEFNGDRNIALARFETTVDTSAPPPTATPPPTSTPPAPAAAYSVYLPGLVQQP